YRLRLAVLRDDRTAVCTDYVDAVLVEVRVEVSHLFLGDLHLLEARGDLGERQKALLMTFANEPSELLHLNDGGLLRQQNLDRQPSILRSRRFRPPRCPGSHHTLLPNNLPDTAYGFAMSIATGWTLVSLVDARGPSAQVRSDTTELALPKSGRPQVTI